MQNNFIVKVIQINDKYFDVFIEKGDILSKVEILASFINSDYEGKEVVFISVLNGSFMFASDLFKKLNLNCEISFVKLSSYDGISSTGNVNELIGLNTEILNKHVIILEDIVDTGSTIDTIIELLLPHRPSSIKTCTLLFKPDAFKGENRPDYTGFTITNTFVVGYGLDYNEKGRNLESIYQLKENANVIN